MLRREDGHVLWREDGHVLRMCCHALSHNDPLHKLVNTYKTFLCSMVGRVKNTALPLL